MSGFVYLPDCAIAVNLAHVASVSFQYANGTTIQFTSDAQTLTVFSAQDVRVLVDALGHLADDTSGRAMRARTARQGGNE